MTASLPNWNVNDRVEAVMRQHERPRMTDAEVEAMKSAANAEFCAALRERGVDPNRFELLVHMDSLVGPMAFVVELATKMDWPLPIFQRWLTKN